MDPDLIHCHFVVPGGLARVFVFPSLQENFPMVLLEAMAAGCAVVTTSAPGCVEVVGDAALIVEPGNPAALKDALARLLADDAAIERLRAASLARAERFASARIAARFEALFESVSSPGSVPRIQRPRDQWEAQPPRRPADRHQLDWRPPSAPSGGDPGPRARP